MFLKKHKKLLSILILATIIILTIKSKSMTPLLSYSPWGPW